MMIEDMLNHDSSHASQNCIDSRPYKAHSAYKNIVLVSGGTGGHVFPATSIADQLVELGHNCSFITDNRGARFLPQKYRDNAYVFYAKTSPRILLYIFIIINVIRFLFKFLFKRKSIDLVMGFGGYPSLPPLIAAQLLGIKTIIHEQNFVIGKANSLLSRYCSLMISSFEGTQSKCKNTVYIGNPTRFENEYTDHSIYEICDTITILVIGGSQGAKIFSSDVVDAICEAYTACKKSFFVYHQALAEDINDVKDKYADHGIECQVQRFFDNISDLYKKSTLVISRSGASSVFEIIGFARPCILIPFMKSINGDQKHNALYLHKRQAAEIYWEDRMNKCDLKNIIISMISDEERMLHMYNQLKVLRIRNITKRICNEIETVTCAARNRRSKAKKQ